MADVRNGSLAPIYQRLNSAPTYHPQETESFADWSVEAGDIVTVSREGTSYSSPVHSTSVSWKKGQQVNMSSSGNKTRGSISKMSQTEYDTTSSASGIRNTKKTYQHIVASYAGMTSGLELAGSSAALYVNNKYTQMESGLKLTESSARLYVNDKYGQMSSGLSLTSSSAALYVNDKYSQMRSGLSLTSSSAALYVNNKYSQMASGLKLTESSAHLYVDNRYTAMTSGLKLTSSSAALYVNNKYSQMSSGLQLTSSSAALYTQDKYSQMQSALKLTSSSAALYVNNKYNQMASGLKLSESSARMYVDSKYNQMSAGLVITSSASALYAYNRTTKAAIIARINGEGKSEAYIEASSILLSGETNLLSGSFTISDGNLKVKKSAIFDGNVTLTTAGSYVQAPNHVVTSSGYLRFNGTQPNEHYDITAASIQDYIKKAEVDGNTLKLWKVSDSTTPSINFSKATTLSGAWSGREYRVTASPQGNVKIGIVYDGLVGTGDVTKDGKWVYRDFIVYSDDGEGDADTIIMTKNIGINASSVYDDGKTEGWNTAVGKIKPPSAQTANNYMDFGTPGSTYGGTNSYRYHLDADSNYVYIKDSAYNVLARMSNSGSATITDLGIYDSNYQAWSGEQYITSAWNLWSGYKNNGVWQWGAMLTVKPNYSGYTYGVTQFKGVDSSGSAKEQVRMRYFNEQRGEWMDCDGSNLHKWYWKD